MFPIWLYCLIFGGVPEHKALSIFTSGYFTYNTLDGLQIYKAKNTIKSNLTCRSDSMCVGGGDQKESTVYKHSKYKEGYKKKTNQPHLPTTTTIMYAYLIFVIFFTCTHGKCVNLRQNCDKISTTGIYFKFYTECNITH